MVLGEDASVDVLSSEVSSEPITGAASSEELSPLAGLSEGIVSVAVAVSSPASAGEVLLSPVVASVASIGVLSAGDVSSDEASSDSLVLEFSSFEGTVSVTDVLSGTVSSEVVLSAVLSPVVVPVEVVGVVSSEVTSPD